MGEVQQALLSPGIRQNSITSGKGEEAKCTIFEEVGGNKYTPS